MKIFYTLFLALLPLAVSAQWTDVSPGGTLWSNWTGVSYGADTFVVVGSTGKIGYSPDGSTWSRATLPVSSIGWKDVEYGTISPGVEGFLAVGTSYPNSYVFSSPDGITWTDVSSTYVPAGTRFYYDVAKNDADQLFVPQQDEIRDSAYLGETFVGLKYSFDTTDIYTSSDGISFSLAVNDHPFLGQSIVSTGSGFLVVGTERRDEGGAFTVPYPWIYSISADGTDWASPYNPTLDATGNLTSVIDVDGTYWTVGNSTTTNANIFYSSTGTNWNRDDVSSLSSKAYDLGEIVYAEGLLVAVGSSDAIVIRSLASVPEPSALSLIVALISVLAVARRRR